jgi:hypothetical protein
MREISAPDPPDVAEYAASVLNGWPVSRRSNAQIFHWVGALRPIRICHLLQWFWGQTAQGQNDYASGQ